MPYCILDVTDRAPQGAQEEFVQALGEVAASFGCAPVVVGRKGRVPQLFAPGMAIAVEAEGETPAAEAARQSGLLDPERLPGSVCLSLL